MDNPFTLPRPRDQVSEVLLHAPKTIAAVPGAATTATCLRPYEPPASASTVAASTGRISRSRTPRNISNRSVPRSPIGETTKHCLGSSFHAVIGHAPSWVAHGFNCQRLGTSGSRQHQRSCFTWVIGYNYDSSEVHDARFQ